MAHVLEIPSFNWKDAQQGLALCQAIQANPFDVVISISNIGRDDSYRILLLSDKPLDAQDVDVPCSPVPTTEDLDALVQLTKAGTVQGLTESIAKTGLSIHLDYPSIPSFEASYVDENCVEGFDPAHPIMPDIPQTVQLMENIQKLGGDPADVSVIVGFPSDPFEPRI